MMHGQLRGAVDHAVHGGEQVPERATDRLREKGYEVVNSEWLAHFMYVRGVERNMLVETERGAYVGIHGQIG